MKQARRDPAPALTRGLALVELLAEEGHCHLERLAARSGWPKSSVLRYLQAMEGAGVVRQDPLSKGWELLKVLRALEAEETDPLSPHRRRLSGLALQTGHCAELYALNGTDIRLVDRADPAPGEVTLNARIGFIRGHEELEAVTLVFFAYGPLSAAGRRFWRWEGGERTPVPARTRDLALAAVRADGLARDHDFNINGIRRFAIPLEEAGTLKGILAVAQRQTPRADREVERILAQLTGRPVPPA